jgi:hypothetical protein
MPMPLRQSKKYYLSVEGETEKWYFEHLRDLINASSHARYKITMKCDVEKSPLDMAKRIVVPKGTTIDIWHVFDFESEADIHRNNFQEALRQMRDANHMGKNLRYRSAYSNFTFDLWMVLHRRGVNNCVDRKGYLQQINDAFGTSFQKMDEYKKEANFKAILSKINLDDVNQAVKRAKAMNEQTNLLGARTAEHCGFTYCLDNPYTELHVPIELMLRETHALPTNSRRAK